MIDTERFSEGLEYYSLSECFYKGLYPNNEFESHTPEADSESLYAIAELAASYFILSEWYDASAPRTSDANVDVPARFYEFYFQAVGWAEGIRSQTLMTNASGYLASAIRSYEYLREGGHISG